MIGPPEAQDRINPLCGWTGEVTHAKPRRISKIYAFDEEPAVEIEKDGYLYTIGEKTIAVKLMPTKIGHFEATGFRVMKESGELSVSPPIMDTGETLVDTGPAKGSVQTWDNSLGAAIVPLNEPAEEPILRVFNRTGTDEYFFYGSIGSRSCGCYSFYEEKISKQALFGCPTAMIVNNFLDDGGHSPLSTPMVNRFEESDNWEEVFPPKTLDLDCITDDTEDTKALFHGDWPPDKNDDTEDNSRRIGRFYISNEVQLGSWDGFIDFLCRIQFNELSCEFDVGLGAYKYIGTSPLFDCVPVGLESFEYKLNIDDE